MKPAPLGFAGPDAACRVLLRKSGPGNGDSAHTSFGQTDVKLRACISE
jgi:hypothetical protein